MYNMFMENMCFITLINSQYVNNRHANKQPVNSENWSVYWTVTDFLSSVEHKKKKCPLGKNKYTKMHLKYMYLMLSTVYYKIHLHIYVHNKITLQFYLLKIW